MSSLFCQIRQNKPVWCWNPGRSHVLWLGVGEADLQSPFWAALGTAQVPTCACAYLHLLSAGKCKGEGACAPSVETLNSLAHSDPRCMVIRSPSHMSVQAALDFLMGMLIIKSPETIIIYSHSRTWVFIQLKITPFVELCWLSSDRIQNPSKQRWF